MVSSVLFNIGFVSIALGVIGIGIAILLAGGVGAFWLSVVSLANKVKSQGESIEKPEGSAAAGAAIAAGSGCLGIISLVMGLFSTVLGIGGGIGFGIIGLIVRAMGY
ncbi:hypothetical protein KAZ57_01090 [Patescibacteria group bacterium]|nr:hypothetical protein [Patescibacteria group bacterium]